MKIYNSKIIKVTISLAIVIVIWIYFVKNIFHDPNITNAKNKYKKNYGKSLEWFIEDFTLTSFAKSGDLSHTLKANNAYKYQENSFIQLNSPYLINYPNFNYNAPYKVTSENALVYIMTVPAKKTSNKKNLTNTNADYIVFNNNILIETPELMAKSESLSYNIEKQFMQLSKNVQTTYQNKKKS